ncbi:MAG: TIGR00153 family protein [Candidatus Helarchaeota archaeon]
MGSLLEWFKTKREVKVIKRTKEHSKKVFECVFELNRAIKEYLNKDVKKVENTIKKINQIENEADEIRREILLDLSKGEMVPQVREDLAHLVKRLDDVANGANAAGRRMALLLREQTMDFVKLFEDELLLIMKDTLEGCEILHEAVEQQLESESDSILEMVSKIKKVEHVVDNDRMNILKKILEIERRNDVTIPPFTAIAISDLIECIESISDAAESVGDLIKIINLERQI